MGRGFSVQYNFLNLPIVLTKGTNVITLTYTADGEKLTKAVTGGGATKNYVGGIEYSGATLEAIYHGEGRCTPNGATAFFYEYTVKDHLGNARVNFRANGTAVTFLEELHYYPFGMIMEGIGTTATTQNKYRYNGKELNDDFGLNLSDYGARWYDAALGRWWSVDPLTEKMPSWSSYNYGFDNPIRFVDPDGRASEAYEGGLSGLALEQRSESIREQNEQNRQKALKNFNKSADNVQGKVYVLALNNTDKSVYNSAIRNLRQYISDATLNVEVVPVRNARRFNISTIDPKNSAVAVVGGTKSEASDFILSNINKDWLSSDFQERLRPGSEFRTEDPSENPETSDAGDGWGYLIATSTQSANKTYSGTTNQRYGISTMGELVALTILHGMGHNAGFKHNANNVNRDNGFMDDASSLSISLTGHYKGNVRSLISDTVLKRPDLINMIKNRFEKYSTPR